MSFLASVGRAQPAGDMATVLRSKLDMEQGERQERLINSRVALNAEHMNQLRRQGEADAAEHQRKSQPYPIDPMLEGMPFGKDGRMAKWAARTGKSWGFTEEIGGVVTANEYGRTAWMEALEKDPVLASQFINEGLIDVRERRAAIEKESEGKSGAALEKIQQEKQYIDQQAAMLTGAMKQINSEFRSKEELASEKLEADRKWQLEQEKLGQTDRLRDETERHNRAMEVINKAKSDKSTSKSGENKKLKELRSDIMSVAGKLHSVRSGQDITSEAMGSEKDTVVKNLEQRLDTMLKQFKKMGGDPSELGFREGEIIPVDTIIVNPKTKTKERLRWDGAEWVPVD
jgi:hypothetical protein